MLVWSKKVFGWFSGCFAPLGARMDPKCVPGEQLSNAEVSSKFGQWRPDWWTCLFFSPGEKWKHFMCPNILCAFLPPKEWIFGILQGLCPSPLPTSGQVWCAQGVRASVSAPPRRFADSPQCCSLLARRDASLGGLSRRPCLSARLPDERLGDARDR